MTSATPSPKRLDLVGREHVHQAIAEYDRLGEEEVLDRYRFRPSRTYVLRYDGRSYHSKPLLAMAHRYAVGHPLENGQFSGGRLGTANVLRDLGFQVEGPEA